MPSLPELAAATPIILSLIIIEGLLSVDNAMAIAAMAGRLPEHQRQLALRLGLLGAYAFRGLALAFVHLLIDNPWVKLAGAAYLLHLMATHFAKTREEGEPEHASGLPLAGGKGKAATAPVFWRTVLAIEAMDFSLSVDNVVAAVAMSPKLWVVCTGVFIGIVTMRLVAGWCLGLIQRFPILDEAAFLLIGYVAALLIAELVAHLEFTSGAKFLGVCIVVALSVCYSRSAALRRVLAPALRIARWPLAAYAAVSNRIFGILYLPIKLVAALFDKKDA